MASRQVAFHRATNEAVTAALQLEEEQRVTRALEREVARLEGTIARRGRRPRRSADEAPRVMRRVQDWPSWPGWGLGAPRPKRNNGKAQRGIQATS